MGNLQKNKAPKPSLKMSKTLEPAKSKDQTVSNTPKKQAALDVERAEKNYKENYQFKQQQSPRVPTSPWETRMIKSEDSYMTNITSPRERALVLGHTSNFGHRGSQIQGNLRVSGKSGSHQIGRKSK